MRRTWQLVTLWCSLLLALLAAVNWWSISIPLSHLWNSEITKISHTCPNQQYQVHIFSKDPLVIYISSFLTTEEIRELTSLSDSEFDNSMILLQDGSTTVLNSTRTSRTAYPPRNDLVKCIERRAEAFQGFGTSTGEMEQLQVVKYGTSAQYRSHYDWSEEFPRQSTFFAYLHSNGTGGGTNFPLIDVPAENEWCEFLACDESSVEGVTFKPIVGNAIYWENLSSDGTVHPQTLHAGLPVISGIKVGLNIWTLRKNLQ